MNLLPQASTVAARYDFLFNSLLGLCLIVAIGVFVVMIGFCVRYRRGTRAERRGDSHRDLDVELLWTVVPFLLFLGLFGWSVRLWIDMRSPPANAQTVYVVAKQWMWKIQHADGRREINALHVPVGMPVRLVMISEDVIHSFSVPAFRVKQDVLPGRYTDLWFTATVPGTYDLFCTEFCGTDHSRMGGSVIAMSPADYAQWSRGHAQVDLAAHGAALFRQFGCSGCHEVGSAVHAPHLQNLYRSTVPLADGSQVVADDRYLHDSITLPNSQVAAGYQPIMPSYEGRIGEDDVLALIAYLKVRGSTPERADVDR